ncbi:MAG: hypothetical protein ACW991_01680 [Candidatus Hodarchaeales archaeon]
MELSDIIGHDIRTFFNEEGQMFLTSFRDYDPKIIETKGILFDIETDIQLSVGTVEDV